MQEKFSFFNILYVVLPTLVMAGGYVLSPLRATTPGPPRALEIEALPVAMEPAGGGLRLAGAWQLKGDDPRMGGWSGLAVEGERLVAVSDGGSILTLAMPTIGGPASEARRQRLAASLRDLPRSRTGKLAKSEVDAESLVADRDGYWVGFEHGHRLQQFDREWRPGLTVDLSRFRWSDNLGAEGLAREGATLVAFPERKGGEAAAVRWDGRLLSTEAVPMLPGVTSGADSYGGRTMLLRRGFGALGFVSWIADSRRAGSAVRLPLTWRDNAEGLAIQPMHDKSARIWVLTDDNFRWPQRTVLVAFDAPPGWWPGGAIDRR